MMEDMRGMATLLKEGNHSLVLTNGDRTLTFDGRGVRDLYILYTQQPELLNGAAIADKVVGKGAAALMIVGKVARLHALVLSRPALELFGRSDVDVTYDVLVDNIINRSGTGVCPVEELCSVCYTPQMCIPLIGDFLSRMGMK